MKNNNALIYIKNDEDKKTKKVYQHIYANITLKDGTIINGVRLDLTFYNRKFMYKLSCGLLKDENNK